MASPRPFLLTPALGIAGSLLGLVAWALSGVGMVELGILERFDPFGLLDDSEESSTATQIAEWSYPAFALIGFFVFPRLIGWLVRPVEEPS